MGACFCTGRCRQPPYRCAAGDFSSRYDPDYEKNLKEQGVLEYLLREAKRKAARDADARRRKKNPGPWAAPVVVPLETDDSRVVPLTVSDEDDFRKIVERIRREDEDREKPKDWWDLVERAGGRRRPRARFSATSRMSQGRTSLMSA